MDNKIYVPAQVEFRAALSALLYYIMAHDDPKDYCEDMVKKLRVAADVIETRLKSEGASLSLSYSTGTDDPGPRG
jgi:hypothetical protein